MARDRNPILTGFLEMKARNAEAKEAERLQGVRQEASTAFQEKDYTKLGGIVAENPELKTDFDKMIGWRNDQTKENAISTVARVKNSSDILGKKRAVADRIKFLLEQKADPTRSLEIYRALQNGDEQPLNDEIGFLDSVYGEKKGSEAAPSKLGKVIAERKAYIDGGGSNDMILKAFDDEVMGVRGKTAGGGKEYAPTDLAKTILEETETMNKRQLLMDAGYAQDSPEIKKIDRHIKAYDKKIRGGEPDLKEWTPERIEIWARHLANGGKLLGLGRGKAAAEIKLMIGAMAAKYKLKQAGYDPSASIEVRDAQIDKAALDMLGDVADTKGMQGSIKRLDFRIRSVSSYVANMDMQYNRMKELKDDIEKFDTRLLNVPLRKLQGKVIGNADLAKWETYLKELSTEMNKVASGATESIAAPSVEDNKKWDEIHDRNLSVGDTLDLVGEIIHSGKMRVQTVQDQVDKAKRDIRRLGQSNERGLGNGGQTPPPQNFDNAPDGSTGTAPDGRKFIKRNGSWGPM